MEKSKFWEDLKTGKFVQMIKESAPGKTLGSSEQAFNILKSLFVEEDDVERMYIVFMTRKNHILAIEKMFSGSIAGASVYPREIIKRVLALKACGIVMCHNHPSGSPEPSPEDLNLTLSIMIPLDCMGVNILDHIIIGRTYYSMADNGTILRINDKVKDLLQGGAYV